MPDVPDLAPCPFCSSPPRLVPADLTAATWVVTCLDCDIEGPWHDSQAAAVDAWNTRPEQARLQALIDECTVTVDRLERELAALLRYGIGVAGSAD